ncbi:MAG: hypothetical protein NTZ34_00360 [Chloroflexi bacterium]|nr:hypothetical protein [Chloroflexota bacterium]
MKVIYQLLLLLTLVCPLFFIACISKEYPVTQNYQETQYKTEITTESYTENQTTVHTESGEYALTSYFNWSTANFYYYGYEIPEAQSYDNISLRLSIWPQLQYEPVMLHVFDMSKTGQIPSPEPLPADETVSTPPDWYFITGTASDTWLKSANTMINQAKLLGATNCLWSQVADPQIIILKAGKPSSIAIIITEAQNKWNCRVNLDALWSRNTVDYQPVTKQRQVSKQVSFQVERQRTVYQVRQVPFWETVLSP